MHDPRNAIRSAQTIGELCESAAARWPDRTIAFPDSGAVVTYAQLVERATRIAAALAARGLEPGALVGLVQANDPEFLLSFLGISLAGGVPTPMPLPASASGIPAFLRRLRSIVVDAGMRRVVVSSLLADHLARLGGAFERRSREDQDDRREREALEVLGSPEQRSREDHDDGGEREALEAVTCAALEAEGGQHRGLGRSGRPDVSTDALGLVQYTSGSTSAPKGVALRHRHVLAAIAAIGDGIQLGPSDVNGQWLPLFHDMGLIGTLTGIAHGTSHVLWQPTTFIRRPDRWLRDFAAAGASIYAGPNFSYAYMIDSVAPDDAAALDLSRWRIAFNGAESIDPFIMERFARHFAPAGFRRSTMFPVYGLAEATLAVTFPALGDEPVTLWVDRRALARDGTVVAVAPEAPEARGVVCVGTPIAGHEVRLAPGPGPGGSRAAGGPVEENVVGEIEVRGPAVMDGYYRRAPEPSAGSGWLATGDLGFLRDGKLYVTGRIKQMLIVRGQNYYPEDIEWTVRAIAGVHKGRNVAVLGDEQAGEPASAPDNAPGAESSAISVIAETTVEPDARAALARRIHETVLEHMGLAVGRVALVRERSIRRTTNGKYQRLLMGQLLRDGELAGEILCDFVPRRARS
jgi:fatty-acyl-CoA synthase